jgi:hypothetical protein
MTNQATDGKVASDDDLRFFFGGKFCLLRTWYLLFGNYLVQYLFGSYINLSQTGCASTADFVVLRGGIREPDAK